MLKVILITLFLALLSSLPVAAAADGGMSSRVAALKASAEQGDRSALWDLGAIYTSGEGDVKRDYREGLKWWRMLADVGGIGSGDALVEIGRLYYDGHGVEQDYAEAARWYRKAAEQGFFQGEFLLGLVYRDGKGVSQSDTEAAKWVRMAAEQNFDSAQTILGSMYENGKGVKKNYAEAAWWYRRASEMNDRRAFYGLGRIYAQGGFGVGQDWSESYFLVESCKASGRT